MNKVPASQIGETMTKSMSKAMTTSIMKQQGTIKTKQLLAKIS